MSYFYKDTIEKLHKMKFFVYLRRSSEDNEDRQIRSIPGQLHDITEFLIDKYHLKIIEPIYKESRTAFKAGRSDFNEMLQKLENGEADGVICWHANRLARNYGDGGRFVQFMSENKIKVVLTCQAMFENNPRDKEYLMTEFTRATRDSDDKSEAVKRGNREKFMEKKQWIGPAKQGYLNTTDPITKEKCIAVDPQRFSLLQKAARLILSEGYTPMQALDTLNNKWGYRTRKTVRQGGKPMCKSSFILSSPIRTISD